MLTKTPKDMISSTPSLYLQKDPFLQMLTPRQKELNDLGSKKMTSSARLRSSIGRNREPVISLRFDRQDSAGPKTAKTSSIVSINQRAVTETSGGYETLMTPRKKIIVVKDNATATAKEIATKEYYEELLNQKILENERMRVEIYRMENEVRISQNNLKTAFNSNKEDTNFTTSQLSDKELKEILQTLRLYMQKSEEAYEDLLKKCSKLDELINYMDSGHLAVFKGLDVQDISDNLKHLLQEFKTTSQLEVEVGMRSRELVKKKLELAHLNSKHNKLYIRCETLQKDLDALKESLKAEHVEKNIFVKNLTKEKTLNRENQKKLGNLQQTLELLMDAPHSKSGMHMEEEFALDVHLKEASQFPTETNQTQQQKNVLPPAVHGHGPMNGQKIEEKIENSTAKLRDALSKLVKENDSLRRIIHVKSKELKKVSDNLSKVTWKLDKANIRIEKLRNLKGGHKMNDGTQDEEDLLVSYAKKKALNAMTTKFISSYFTAENHGLPKNLDFRFGFFEERYVDLVNDVLEGGSQAFAEHVRMLSSDEEVREEIQLISNQFISYRNFSEKLNRMITECFQLYSIKSVNQAMLYISTAMKQIFGAHTIRVWAHEHNTGTLRTMETADKELKCLVNRGLMSEVIKSSERVLKRSREDKYVVLEYLHNDGSASEEKAHTCMLVPLKSPNGMITGILEVSKFSYEAFLLDLEYFASILVELCSHLFEKINTEKAITNDLKHKEMYFDAFTDLANSLSDREFAEKVEEWVPQILQTSRAQYFQAKPSELIRFPKGENQKVFTVSIGLIGKVAAQKKPFILLENSGTSIYSENIDMKTTFPIYTTPVILKKKQVKPEEDDSLLVGVLQIVMNQKYVAKGLESEDNLANYVKTLDPGFESLIAKLTKMIGIAYDVMTQRKTK